MARIVDGVLHSLEEKNDKQENSSDALPVHDEGGDGSWCPATALLSMADRILAEHGDRPSVVEADHGQLEEGGRRREPRVKMLSQFAPESRRLARALLRAIHPDAASGRWTVHACLKASPDFLVTLLATWLAGGVFSSSDPELGSTVMRRQMELLERTLGPCEVVFASPGQTAAKAVEAAAAMRKREEDKSGPVVVLVGAAGDEVEAAGDNVITLEDFVDRFGADEVVPDEMDAEKDADGVCLVNWTSGTSGEPKGIGQSCRSLLRNLAKVPDATDVGTVFIQTNRMFHAAGIYTSLRCCLACGMTDVAFSHEAPFGPGHVYAEAARHRAASVVVMPHHAERMMSEPPPDGMDLTSVRKVPLGFEEKMSEFFPNCRVSQGYGMTECGHLTQGGASGGVLGRIVPGVKAKVVDTESGKILGPRQVGEICIKTGSMMSGYLGDDDDDDVSRARFDPEGFFRTGDLGWYDPAGVLHYSDRAKDVIKVSSNLHVSPAEVEQIIRSIPGVLECCAFGLPDPVLMEVVAAAVVVDDRGDAPDEGAVEAAVADAADADGGGDSRLLLRGGVWRIVRGSGGGGGSDETVLLPRTSTGKLLRRKVREMALAARKRGEWGNKK